MKRDVALGVCGGILLAWVIRIGISAFAYLSLPEEWEETPANVVLAMIAGVL